MNRRKPYDKGQWQLARERFQIAAHRPPPTDSGAVPLAALIPEALQRMKLGTHAFVARIAADWPGLVGPQLAANTRPAHLDNNVLAVYVSHPAWLMELRGPPRRPDPRPPPSQVRPARNQEPPFRHRSRPARPLTMPPARRPTRRAPRFFHGVENRQKSFPCRGKIGRFFPMPWKTPVLVFTFLILHSSFFISPASAGRLEQTPAGPVLHLTIFDLPDPSRTDPATRAELAVQREFLRRAPDLLRARQAADPARYGNRDLSALAVRLHRAAGIKVEGVESTLLAIAGNVAPDVLYVNFRQSDT